MYLQKTNKNRTILHLATSKDLYRLELLKKIAEIFAKLELSPEEIKNFLLEKDNYRRNMLHVAMMNSDIRPVAIKQICKLSKKAQLSTAEFKNDFLHWKDILRKNGIDYFNENYYINNRSKIIKVLEKYFPSSSSGALAARPKRSLNSNSDDSD